MSIGNPLRAFTTVSASTTRSTTLAGNRTGAAATYLTGLLITPLWPLNASTVESLGISSPVEAKECYFVPSANEPLPDIVEGDGLIVGGVSYPIDNVSEWTAVAGLPACLRIVVNSIKREWPTVAGGS